MSKDVIITIGMDTSEANVSIDEVKARAEAITKQWKIDRNTLMRQIREGFTMISSLMSSFRQAMSLFGAQIDPFFGALIGMVLSTASMIISAGTVLEMTVFGAPVGILLVALGISFQILTIGKLIADKAETMNLLGKIQYAMSQTMEKRAWGFG